MVFALMLFASSFFLLLSHAPCYAANEEYYYLPAFYSSVDEAFAAINNMRNQYVGWQGTPPQKIELDRFGLRVFGVLDYTVTTQEWVGGVIFGNWVDVQKPAHLEETTIIPFDRLLDLKLMHYPDLDKEYKWGVCAIISGSEPEAFRTPTRELATVLFNAIASLSQASGHPVNLPRMGAIFRDITAEDLETEEIKALGLSKPAGMIVTHVLEESPAKAGGMLAGDVITGCNDQPVVSYAQWSRDIYPTATSFIFKVLKKGKSTVRFVELTPLESLPQPPAGLVFPPPAAAASTGTKPPKLGFSLRAPNLLEKQALNGKQAAVISSISPGGLAEAAQLQVGDVLLECNGKPILGPEGLGSLLTGGTNTFTVMRNGSTITVKVTPEVSY